MRSAGSFSLCLMFAGILGMITGFSGTAPTVAADSGSGWFAGVAKADITPAEPLWMAGYASRAHPAEGILQPLSAKALALRDGTGNQVVLITCDILGFPSDVAARICAGIKERYGLDRERILLSASHTHSGPVIGNSLRCIYPYDDAESLKIERYTSELEEKIMDIAGEALGNLAPAVLSAGNGTARFAVNRRNNKEGELTATSALQGPQDHAVPTLKVTGDDGSLRAVVFGYACHATVLDGYLWSGDYPGFAQAALEREYPGATALFFAGCGADMNPLPRRSVALARQYGETLAAAVTTVIEGEMRSLDARIDAAYAEIALDMDAPPDRESLRQRVEAASGYERACSQVLLDTLDREGALPTSYPYPLQAWKLGGLSLAILSGEVVVEYSIALKAEQGQELFVMGYANDLMAYIPSERILAEGGYEGCKAQMIYGLPNCWAPGIEEKILSSMRALLAPAQ